MMTPDKSHWNKLFTLPACYGLAILSTALGEVPLSLPCSQAVSAQSTFLCPAGSWDVF